MRSWAAQSDSKLLKNKTKSRTYQIITPPDSSSSPSLTTPSSSLFSSPFSSQRDEQCSSDTEQLKTVQDVDLDANAFLIVANDANAAIHPITRGPWFHGGFVVVAGAWYIARCAFASVGGENGGGCFFLVGFLNLELVVVAPRKFEKWKFFLHSTSLGNPFYFSSFYLRLIRRLSSNKSLWNVIIIFMSAKGWKVRLIWNFVNFLFLDFFEWDLARETSISCVELIRFRTRNQGEICKKRFSFSSLSVFFSL